MVSNSNANYSTCRNASSADVADYNSQTEAVGQSHGTSYAVHRGFLSFDASSIPDTASIDSAILYVYRGSVFTGGRNFSIVVTQGSNAPTSLLSPEDYSRISVLDSGGVMANNLVSGGYTAIPLSITGIEFINKIGFTKLALRSQFDIASSEPTGDEWCTIYTQNVLDQNKRPKLVIAYTEAPRTISASIVRPEGDSVREQCPR